MKLDLSKPILYLITRGATTETTTGDSPEFKQILEQISSAVAAGIDLIQIREKRLAARVLFELTEHAVAITRGTDTQLLVNDRADIAAAVAAGGVHLATTSLPTSIIRATFGDDFLIGASTHSREQLHAARDGGADFAVFGPIFETGSKLQYGPPLGLEQLTNAARELPAFPLLALGGMSVENAQQCIRAGASGIAGITLFADSKNLKVTVAAIRSLTLVIRRANEE